MEERKVTHRSPPWQQHQQEPHAADTSSYTATPDNGEASHQIQNSKHNKKLLQKPQSCEPLQYCSRELTWVPGRSRYRRETPRAQRTGEEQFTVHKPRE